MAPSRSPDDLIDFRSDNTGAVAPEILAAVAEANSGTAAGYGMDRWSAELHHRFSDLFQAEASVSSDPDLQVVELARQLRRRRSARQEVGRGVGRRRGGISESAPEDEPMSQACSGGSNGQATRRTAAAFRAADRLGLAASPTFAIMALLTGLLGGDPAAMHGSAAHVSPLSGMVTMYLLMSAFHAAHG